MKLNCGSFYSEYVQLASQAGGENRTEQGVPWNSAGPSPRAQRRTQCGPSPGAVRGSARDVGDGSMRHRKEPQEGARQRWAVVSGKGSTAGRLLRSKAIM